MCATARRCRVDYLAAKSSSCGLDGEGPREGHEPVPGRKRPIVRASALQPALGESIVAEGRRSCAISRSRRLRCSCLARRRMVSAGLIRSRAARAIDTLVLKQVPGERAIPRRRSTTPSALRTGSDEHRTPAIVARGESPRCGPTRYATCRAETVTRIVRLAGLRCHLMRQLAAFKSGDRTACVQPR
jgi:hypothetical protein